LHPNAFNLGPLVIHWYGVMVALAFLAGLWTASRRALLTGIAGEKIMDLGPWLIGGAIVGARIFYVASYWNTLVEEPLFPQAPWTEIFMVQRGGLVFYGGLVGASLACLIYARVRALPLWKMADILAPSIALGSVFGRVGCLLNGCCFGRVCSLPWAIQFPNQSPVWKQHYLSGLVGKLEASAPVHPTQIYDALLNLGLYLGLALLYRRKRFDGQVFATYLIGYAVTRSFVEIFRGDYPPENLHGGLTPAHLVSAAILVAGLVSFWILSRRAVKRG
jgi:phosphatidylglycerol---prolipoprotein diacylglyceryl transferase